LKNMRKNQDHHSLSSAAIFMALINSLIASPYRNTGTLGIT
jgi:hypothetical protein